MMSQQALMDIAKLPAFSFACRGEYRAVLEVAGA
jgi:hypothetical protein